MQRLAKLVSPKLSSKAITKGGAVEQSKNASDEEVVECKQIKRLLAMKASQNLQSLKNLEQKEANRKNL